MLIHFDVLFLGGSIFLCCLLLHVLLWRMRRPRNHASALLLVFLGAGAALLFVSPLFLTHFSRLDLFAAALLHVSLSCAYIQVYPASQADSPSLKILVMVGNSAPNGMTQAEIHARFHPDELFAARIHDLLDAQLIRQIDGALILTSKGSSFVKPFLVLRKFLGLTAGKG